MVDALDLGSSAFGVRVRVSSRPDIKKEVLTYLFSFKRIVYMNKVFIGVKFVVLLFFLSIAFMCLPHINLNFRTLLPLLVNTVILIAIVVLLYKKFKK